MTVTQATVTADAPGITARHDWATRKAAASTRPSPRLPRKAARYAGATSPVSRAIVAASAHGKPAARIMAQRNCTFCRTLTAPNSDGVSSHARATPNP
jgi:hypothetical protein